MAATRGGGTRLARIWSCGYSMARARAMRSARWKRSSASAPGPDPDGVIELTDEEFVAFLESAPRMSSLPPAIDQDLGTARPETVRQTPCS